MESKSIISNFNALLAESFQNDLAENVDFYKDLGVEKEAYLMSNLRFINRLKIKSTAKRNRIKNQKLIEDARVQLKEIITSRIQSTKEKLEQLIRQEYPQFQFRNLDVLDDEDIKEALSEIDLIDFIEKLDKIENG
ncbi:MAG: hypothetical protein R2764_23805 [Bacteroidales bacterium]